MGRPYKGKPVQYYRFALLPGVLFFRDDRMLLFLKLFLLDLFGFFKLLGAER
jgi:hypothetical protein